MSIFKSIDSTLLNASTIEITCPNHVQPIDMPNYFEAMQQILVRDNVLLPRWSTWDRWSTKNKNDLMDLRVVSVNA